MRFHFALLYVVAALPLSGCYGLYGHDQLAAYAQRKDTVTLSAGDAKEVNARTHMIAAWPRGVGDRAIPMAGTRGVRAMECYRQGGGNEQVGNIGSEQTSINSGTNNNSGSGSISSGAGGSSAQATQLRC